MRCKGEPSNKSSSTLTYGGFPLCTYPWCAPISGMSYLQCLGLDGLGAGGGELTCSHNKWNQPPYLHGAQSSIPSPHISLTNTPYLPVVHSVWQGDMDICTYTNFTTCMSMEISSKPWGEPSRGSGGSPSGFTLAEYAFCQSCIHVAD